MVTGDSIHVGDFHLWRSPAFLFETQSGWLVGTRNLLLSAYTAIVLHLQPTAFLFSMGPFYFSAGLNCQNILSKGSVAWAVSLSLFWGGILCSENHFRRNSVFIHSNLKTVALVLRGFISPVVNKAKKNGKNIRADVLLPQHPFRFITHNTLYFNRFDVNERGSII